MPDADEESFLNHGEDGVQAPGPPEGVERRCSGVSEGLERISGLRERPCKGSACTLEWIPHPPSGSWPDTETSHICTSWALEEPGFLDERMDDHVTMCESVCVDDESENRSNINLFELSRIKEGFG